VDEDWKKGRTSGRYGGPGETGADDPGFGAAFTDASCFTLSRLGDSDRANLLHTMFGQDRHALSMGRIRSARAITAPRHIATMMVRPIRS